jgi:hypothetical protein
VVTGAAFPGVLAGSSCSSGGGSKAGACKSRVIPASASVVADCWDAWGGKADSGASCSVVGWWVPSSGISGVAAVLGLGKKHRSVAIVGGGSSARLFWQLLKQAQDVQRMFATRQGQAKDRAVGRERAHVDDLEQSQQRWRSRR